MLSQAMNDRLTRVGPGTPCGELMRRYWLPIAPFAQLLENPVRKVRVLGEDLILYRDRSGGLGLIGDRCLHRSVDLQFGIPDECGLRCPYHGWLYDATGNCIERPLEASPRRPIQQKLTGYPVQELGGLVFAYMGTSPAPALPRWDLLVWPNALRQIAINVLDCNWLQCQENTGDPTHSVWTHGRLFQYALEREGRAERAASLDHTIHTRLRMGVGIKDLYAEATTYGMRKGVVYSKDLGADADRVDEHSTVIFPFYTQTGMAGSPRSEYQIRVPIDDTHTYHICYQVYAAPAEIEAPHQDVIPWYEPPTVDANGQPILDYVLSQDAMMWKAQGELVDRTQEVLARTDIPIVFLRRQLDEQIALVEAGKTPMNVFSESPAILFGAGHPPEEDKTDRALRMTYRRMYHKGYANDDADGYGPAIELVKDLHRRIEEAQSAAASPSRLPDLVS
ncbi:MAG TPA: Rieske 2Fe-2S domain-containing protein [Candidatus Aquilonibacter sp.]